MLSSDKNIECLAQLIEALRNFVTLQGEYLKSFFFAFYAKTPAFPNGRKDSKKCYANKSKVILSTCRMHYSRKSAEIPEKFPKK